MDTLILVAMRCGISICLMLINCHDSQIRYKPMLDERRDQGEMTLYGTGKIPYDQDDQG